MLLAVVGRRGVTLEYLTNVPLILFRQLVGGFLD
jgi:hypothetical protein